MSLSEPKSRPSRAQALKPARPGIEPGDRAKSRRFVAPELLLGLDIAPELVALAHDPQTSGGLLAAIPRNAVKALHADLEAAGVRHWAVGRVEAAPEPGVQLA